MAFVFHGLELVCPACRSDLTRVQDTLRCATCPRDFPVLLGIPDLRLWPDPYIGIAEDRAKGAMLADACRDLGFEESVELYYRVTSAVPPFQARRFARSLLAAPARSAALLQTLHARHPPRHNEWLLDLGCGTAPLLVAGASSGTRGAGVDIAFRWLVMAQKRLTEAGVSAPLICACAEALPFRNRTFDRVIAESTLEHLRDQRAALRECARVLRPGAPILLTTPNRHSVGPDPHTGLPAGGWLPETVSAAYVRRKGGKPPVRHLVTHRELHTLLAHAGFERIEVQAPDVSASQRASLGRLTALAVDAYHLARRIPGGAAAARTFGPLLQAEAQLPAQ